MTLYTDLLELAQKYPVPGTLVLVALTLGAFHAAVTVGSLLRTLTEVLTPGGGLHKYKTNSRTRLPWAIITGPTAGIGQEYANQLAQQGFNIGLVGRNKSKLDDVAASLKQYKVQTQQFVLDFSTALNSDYEKLSKWANELGGVPVLINNVGISHEMPVPFAETSHDEMMQIIHVNNVATLEVTRAVLPALRSAVSSKLVQRGLILTMGSFAGLTPTPLLAVYSGSKAFLQAWNNAIASELAPEKIDAQLVISYLVTSNMSKVKRTSLMIPNPKSFVASSINNIGRNGGAQERAYTSTPYWSHALLHWALNAGPGVWSQVVATINRNMHVDIRKRALRKKERDAQKKQE